MSRTPRRCRKRECEEKHLANGLCRRHYSEARRRAEGVEARGELKPRRLEFVAEEALVSRFHAVTHEGDRGAALREALERWVGRAERRARHAEL